jgi:hypothetical protein
MIFIAESADSNSVGIESESKRDNVAIRQDKGKTAGTT